MNISEARRERREQIVEAALALIGCSVPYNFDMVHSPITTLDVAMVAGAPWLKDALEKDFYKDESGYKKIGGGANTPKNNYFCRNATNLIHFLKRQGLYTPRGGKIWPEAGMACFLDWDDRGRFNFAPDRSGIIIKALNGQIEEIVMAIKTGEDDFMVKRVTIIPKSDFDNAIIGYSDLP